MFISTLQSAKREKKNDLFVLQKRELFHAFFIAKLSSSTYLGRLSKNSHSPVALTENDFNRRGL